MGLVLGVMALFCFSAITHLTPDGVTVVKPWRSSLWPINLFAALLGVLIAFVTVFMIYRLHRGASVGYFQVPGKVLLYGGTVFWVIAWRAKQLSRTKLKRAKHALETLTVLCSISSATLPIALMILGDHLGDVFLLQFTP